MLKIGDIVKASRVFRDPDFRFSGSRKIIGIDYFVYRTQKSYILEDKEDICYLDKDLIKIS